MLFGKRENTFIKDNIPKNIDATSANIQTFEPFMNVVVSKENTLFGAKLRVFFGCRGKD
jgi:hypothetical protein